MSVLSDLVRRMPVWLRLLGLVWAAGLAVGVVAVVTGAGTGILFDVALWSPILALVFAIEWATGFEDRSWFEWDTRAAREIAALGEVIGGRLQRRWLYFLLLWRVMTVSGTFRGHRITARRRSFFRPPSVDFTIGLHVPPGGSDWRVGATPFSRIVPRSWKKGYVRCGNTAVRQGLVDSGLIALVGREKLGIRDVIQYRGRNGLLRYRRTSTVGAVPTPAEFERVLLVMLDIQAINEKVNKLRP